jgi:hypothetical protein
MSQSNTKKGLELKKKEEFVSEKSFIKNFTLIFIGDLDQKMKFTFDLYVILFYLSYPLKFSIGMTSTMMVSSHPKILES